MACKPCHRERGGVYIVVLGTAMFVTVVGLSALLMARVNTRISNANQDTVKARYYAQSLIEVGMLKAMSDSNWRTTHTNDTWVADYTWDEAVVTYKFVDENDGDLADNPTENVRLYAKATVNDAVRIYSVELQQPSGSTESNEVILSSYDPASSSWDFTASGYYSGQHFTPPLPPGTTSWSVTRVKFMAQSHGNGSDGVINVQLRTADVNKLPTATVLEQYVLNESSLSGSPTWQEYAFSSVAGLSSSDRLCLVLEHAQGINAGKISAVFGTAPPGRVLYSSGWSYQNSTSIVHYIYGKYITSPPLTPIAGTWRREVLP